MAVVGHRSIMCSRRNNQHLPVRVFKLSVVPASVQLTMKCLSLPAEVVVTGPSVFEALIGLVM